MDESQKQKLRQAKAEAVEALRAIPAERYAALAETDPRLRDYCEMVRNEPEHHNLYEVLAVVRFFHLRERYEWGSKAVRRFIAFAETVKLSGTTCRRRYKATPVQVFQYASIWGFRHNGKRLVRRACLFIPRKFSKTTTCAIFAAYDMMYGDANAQAYVTANSYDQAQQCFREIRDIVNDIDPQNRFFKTNRHTVLFKRKERNTFAKCLSSKISTKDGLSASLVLCDEFSQATSSENLTVLTTSMATRREPLTIIITTASDKLFGPFATLLDSYKKVMRGEVEADTLFAHIFEPDVDDEESDPNTWRKVQPHYGITVQEDFYENAYRDALLDPNEMMAFRTKLLNIFAEADTKVWMTYQQANDLLRDRPLSSWEGRPDAMVAFDLSVRDDFSAVAYQIYDKKNKAFHTHVDYYFPEGALPTHPNRELYTRWAADGHLKLCKGEVIDYAQIVNDILAANEYITIVNIGYDAYKSLTCVNLLRGAIGYDRADKVLRAVPQTYGHYTASVDSFQYGALTGKETLNNNPINVFCITNAVIDVDRMMNKKPVQRNVGGRNATSGSSPLKIDGLIVTLMAHWLFNNWAP